MMYAAILAYFMMTTPWVLAGESVCLKRLVSGPSCTVYAEDYNCTIPGDQLLPDGTCVQDCVSLGSTYDGQTFQQYNGIDVICEEMDESSTFDNLEACKQWCRADDICLTGSYNSSDGLCLKHGCDQQGNFHYWPDYGIDYLDVLVLSELGPCITFFVKNCY